MNWRERVAAYEALARKVIQGLGWPGSKLRYLCKVLDIPYDDANSDFDLAKEVLNAVSDGSFHPSSPARKFVVDSRPPGKNGTCWSDEDELCDLCSVAKSTSDGLLVLCRIGGKTGVPDCRAFMFTQNSPEPRPYLLKPVSTLLALKNGVAVWVRKADSMIRDMAEYYGWNVPEHGE